MSEQTSEELRTKIETAVLDWLHLPASDLPPSFADALMPVIREHLADAWDHGHRTANPVVPDAHRDVINPWKQQP